MDINEAIVHASEKAEELGDCECGLWYKQVAQWLEELVFLKEVIKGTIPLQEKF